MSYDPAGRLYQTSPSWFAYDGTAAVAEHDTATAALTARFVWGAGMDDSLVDYTGTGTTNRRWLLTDERGSVIARVNGSNVATSINTYDEYGTPGSGNGGRFQYTGQMWLSSIALQNSRARFYQPQLGRFMQPDPIGYEAGANLYAYVGADPINFTDPMGMGCEGITVTPIIVPANGSDEAQVPDICVTGFRPTTPSICTLNPTLCNPSTTPGVTQLDDIVVNVDRSGGGGNSTGRSGTVVTRSLINCLGSSVRNNASVLALDALSVGASFVPGGRGLLSVGATIVGVNTGVATIGISVYNRDLAGGAIGAGGHYVSLASGLFDLSRGIAQNLPVIGQVLAVGGLAYDLYGAARSEGCL